jgi:hypothetical protein
MRGLVCEVVWRERLLLHVEGVCVVEMILLLPLLLHMLVLAVESMERLLNGLHCSLRRGHR